MSKDQKAETKKLRSVQFLGEIRLFARPMRSVSENMHGIKSLSWDGQKVVVIGENDAEVWIGPAAIAAMEWKSV